jgi:hypothetical protein
MDGAFLKSSGDAGEGGAAHTLFCAGEVHGRMTQRAEEFCRLVGYADNAKVTGTPAPGARTAVLAIHWIVTIWNGGSRIRRQRGFT